MDESEELIEIIMKHARLQIVVDKLKKQED